MSQILGKETIDEIALYVASQAKKASETRDNTFEEGFRSAIRAFQAYSYGRAGVKSPLNNSWENLLNVTTKTK